MKIFGCNDF